VNLQSSVPSPDESREPASRIRNTSAENEVELQALLMLANAMSGGKAEDAIYAQEAAGQRQLVNSDRLPTDAKPDDAAYEALGITFGEPDPSDPMFRPATLPEGWKRQPTDHSMWSEIVDAHGRERIAVFYKAAFYDRRAFMRIESPVSYLRGVVFDGVQPVLDDEWLTRDIAVEALTALERDELERANRWDEFAQSPGQDTEYWTGEAATVRAEAAKYAAMRERIEASA
jgi:hypothetical protein